MYVAHAAYTNGIVRWCLGDIFPYTTRSNTDTADTSCSKRVVAVVVPQPVFHSFASLWGTYVDRKVRGLQHTVVHGFEPLVVSLHPSEIIIGFLLIAK